MPASGEPADKEFLATAAALAILKMSSWLLDELQPVFLDHGITATRFDTLDALSRTGTGTRPAELRDILHLPAQTLTGVVDQLEGVGLVRRVPNPADRRSILVELTERGQATIERVCPPLIDVEEDCLATLSPAERRLLVDLLAKIETRILERRSGHRG
jgi:DNA-binding MarR family transcriptional regulator